ncbi:hypothetical protein DRQ12_08195 [candidate division KSB1 bacterium]|nr:MAG: hypothetical protein DRQ12_08195 [candidate division KSB1 bacterium]
MLGLLSERTWLKRCQHVLPRGFMKIRHYGFLNPKVLSLLERYMSSSARPMT